MAGVGDSGVWGVWCTRIEGDGSRMYRYKYASGGSPNRFSKLYVLRIKVAV